jgi:hypothetical protein
MKVKNLIRLLALQDSEADVHLLHPGSTVRTPVTNVEEVHEHFFQVGKHTPGEPRPTGASVVVLLS